MILSLVLGIIVSFPLMGASGIDRIFYADIATFAERHLNLSHESWSDEKVFSTTTLDDDFADDTVSVVLTRRASLQLREFTADDFPEVRLSAVEQTASFAKENIREQLSAMQVRNFSRDTSQDINIENFRQTLTLTLQEPGRENVLRAIRMLERRSDIFGVSPNYRITIPCMEYATHSNIVEFQANNQTTNWALERIGARQAWGITTGSPNITVGILDTGIDGNHFWLRNVIHPSSNMHADFVGGGFPLVDPNGHGTHVAGTVASDTNGLTGVAWNISLASLRVLDSRGEGTMNAVYRAVRHASMRGIQILNASLGGSGRYLPLEQAIRDFNGLFVAAAGNNNRNTDLTPFFPASIRLPNLISVGASNESDGRGRWGGILGIGRSGSNFGATSVCIFAPGVSIFSTEPNGRFGEKTGTSMAAPFVAGTAALMLSINPNLNSRPDLVRNKIIQTVNLPSDLNNYSISRGRLNVRNAVNVARLATLQIGSYSMTIFTFTFTFTFLSTACPCPTSN